VYQSLASYYLKRKRNDLAAGQFEKMLRCPELSDPARNMDGPSLRLGFFLANHYGSAGRPADAARIYAFLVERFPKRPEFHLARARQLLAAGDGDGENETEALRETAVFERLLPDSSAGSRMLALHYARKGRPAEALARAERVINKLGTEPGAPRGDLAAMRYLRAELLRKLRRFAAARAELEGLLAAAADDGEKVDALVALTYLDRAEGKPGQAARRVRKALGGGLKSGRLYGALAGALEAQGQPDEAARAYRRALALSPRDLYYRMSLAGLLEKQGRRSAAAAELRAALQVKPTDPACCNMLAWLYAREAINLAEAARLAETARLADPESGHYLHTLGRVRYRQGRVAESRTLLERAAMRAQDAIILEHLGDACFALGLWRRAGYAWRKALELDPGRPGPRRKLERMKGPRG